MRQIFTLPRLQTALAAAATAATAATAAVEKLKPNLQAPSLILLTHGS